MIETKSFEQAVAARRAVIAARIPYRVAPARDAQGWPICQKCGQSATGKYNGVFGCSRDGWMSK